MDMIFEVILPILGFILAIVGAWDKLRFGIKYITTKRSVSQLKLAEFELEKIEKYNSSLNYFVAYQFKHLFSIIIVLLAVMLVNSFPILVELESHKVLFSFHLALCWLAGFFSGQAMRAINCVLHKDKLTSKYERKVKQLSEKIEART
ncbi:hypothetical protein IC830_06505 [Vibrio parahaemolyticus]|nr:hypothetical protein [Vibrio parahaemolyticus]QOW05728.1 hypothetical protein IC830_06505 [Vibrio parahaemolyticus]